MEEDEENDGDEKYVLYSRVLVKQVLAIEAPHFKS
jgi:hypothetical protein